MKKFLILIFIFSSSLFSQNKVTCQFRGQLGNQLFEIAATVSYALDHNLQPVFPGLLSAWGGAENYAAILKGRISLENPDVIWRSIGESVHPIYAPLRFVPNENICLMGYFQSEKYFLNHAQTIRELFSPNIIVKKNIYEKWGNLLTRNSVGIHVRTFHTDGKGPDVMFNGGYSAFIDYFERAIELFPSDYTFLVFSDDIAWCKKYLPQNRNLHFIENNPRHIDLFLMSFCHHQIVSPDSTFSWWAAWLNEHPDKIVITTKEGYGNESFDWAPATWIKI